MPNDTETKVLEEIIERRKQGEKVETNHKEGETEEKEKKNKRERENKTRVKITNWLGNQQMRESIYSRNLTWSGTTKYQPLDYPFQGELPDTLTNI